MKSLKELAAELGVSTATISYVHNNKWREKRISDKLAREIQSRLEAENFRPNMLGKQLRTGRTMTVGAIFPDLDRPHALNMLKGMERELTKNDYTLLLANSVAGAKEPALLSVFFQRNVDGALICPYSPAAAEARAAGTPIVCFDNYLRGFDGPFVVSDNVLAAKELTLGMLTGSGGAGTAYLGTAAEYAVCLDRFQGYKDAFRAAGMRTPAPELIERKVVGDKKLADSLAALLRRAKPGAVFVESFLYFEEGLRFLARNKIRVPEDLVLAGVDDPSYALKKLSEKERAFFRAPIPFAEQDAEEIGSRAVKILLSMINGETPSSPRNYIKAKIHS